MKPNHYDVIVIGGGHAGCEAATASANMGALTLLITMDMNKIAQMSCNPAIGGIAKGQIVREIDALGGQMGLVTDATAIQFRMLNRSKGPAVWSPRAQCDRGKFIWEWRRMLDATPNLDIWQDQVDELLVEKSYEMSTSAVHVTGVRTIWGAEFRAPCVILTAGTFLNGLMHIGRRMVKGGRIAEPAAERLTESISRHGIRTGRMKTGTPVRIDRRSVHFEDMTRQDGENPPYRFSYLHGAPSESLGAAAETLHETVRTAGAAEGTLQEAVRTTGAAAGTLQETVRTTGAATRTAAETLPQLPCFECYTNPAVHETLRSGLNDSPLYNGQIQSIGPRYCPSIETKLVTFPDREQHLLFLEPEGTDTNEMYLNGFSSSLPMDVQIAALRHIPALRDVKIYRPGYAIEYDFFDPTQLSHTLESKVVGGLFMAGQVNGTTGYEEAGGQGTVAGINAALKAGAAGSVCCGIATTNGTPCATTANGTPATTANGTPATAANGTPATTANGTPATAANGTPATTANGTPCATTTNGTPTTTTTNGTPATANGTPATTAPHPTPTGAPLHYQPFTLARDEAYIGVLIDDLVTKGVDEPYRMFTSRAEYRILLRQDDADARLTERGYHLGIVTRQRYDWWLEKRNYIDKIEHFCNTFAVKPRNVNGALEHFGSTPLQYGCKLSDLVSRPELNFEKLQEVIPELKELLNQPRNRRYEISEAAEIRIKYKGYIERERLVAEKMHRLENIKIRGHFDYEHLNAISTEARQKLMKIQPETLAQASRIPGVSPSDINAMLVLMGR